MTRRRLNPDELELWRRVASRTERLNQEKPAPRQELLKPKPKTEPPTVSYRRVDPFQIGQTARPRGSQYDVQPGLPEQLAAQPVSMDKKVFGRLKKGKLTPEGRIDLHGKTLDQAHPILSAFIRRSHFQGKRLVLVITGKGKQRDEGGPIPVRHGVLRHAVPQWLRTPPLSSMVLQISEAHVKHGGGGAYYVYLRRNL